MTPAELRALRATNLTRAKRTEARTWTEQQFLREVLSLCDELGITYCRPRSLRGIPRGWPDIVIITPRRVLWRELKTHTGKLTPEQRQLGQWLRQAGESWGIWKPHDLACGAIRRELSDLTATQGQLWAG